MADIASLLAQGSKVDPVGAIAKGQQLRGNSISNSLNQEKLDQAPQRARVLDLQIQSAENVIDAQEQSEIDKLNDQEKVKLVERIEQAASLVGQTQSKEEVISILQQGGFDPDEQLLNPNVDHATAIRLVQSRSKAYRDAALKNKPIKPTSAQQNAQFAFPGDQQAQRDAVAKKFDKTPLVTITDNAEAKEKAKVQGGRLDRLTQAGEQALEMIESISQIEAIDAATGPGESAKLAVAQIASAFGFPELASRISNITNAQAFNAASNRLVNAVLNKAKGPQTEGDAQRARSTIASLKGTPQANGFISASLKAVALRQAEQADFIHNLTDNGSSISAAFRAWSKFKIKTPSLSGVIKTPEGLPMFFYQFKERARQVRPDISDKDIIEAWRGKHGK